MEPKEITKRQGYPKLRTLAGSLRLAHKEKAYKGVAGIELIYYRARVAYNRDIAGSLR